MTEELSTATKVVLHAPSNEKPTSQIQTDTKVVLDAASSGLRLGRERGKLNRFDSSRISIKSVDHWKNLNVLFFSKLHKSSMHCTQVLFFKFFRVKCSLFAQNDMVVKNFYLHSFFLKTRPGQSSSWTG